MGLKINKWGNFVAGVSLVLALAIGGLLALALTSMKISDLIICSSDDGAFRIPRAICYGYLKLFRMDPEDIRELQDGAGLSFVLGGDDPMKYELAALFLDEGLDIEGVNHYGMAGSEHLTPLQAAVMMNNTDDVAFLLSHGANAQLLNRDGLTLLELARLQQKKIPGYDYSAVIELLEKQ